MFKLLNYLYLSKLIVFKYFFLRLQKFSKNRSAMFLLSCFRKYFLKTNNLIEIKNLTKKIFSNNSRLIKFSLIRNIFENEISKKKIVMLMI